jgi:hypothetical protein
VVQLKTKGESALEHLYTDAHGVQWYRDEDHWNVLPISLTTQAPYGREAGVTRPIEFRTSTWRVHHRQHLVATILTGGLWSPVWIFKTWHRRRRQRISHVSMGV